VEERKDEEKRRDRLGTEGKRKEKLEMKRRRNEVEEDRVE
jgi:hypothetical protein